MNEEQKECNGCEELFPKDKLTEEERTYNDEPVGTFFWCGNCLLKELEDWKKKEGEKTINIKLGESQK